MIAVEDRRTGSRKALRMVTEHTAFDEMIEVRDIPHVTDRYARNPQCVGTLDDLFDAVLLCVRVDSG